MGHGNKHRHNGNHDTHRHGGRGNDLGSALTLAVGSQEFMQGVRHHPDHPKQLTDPIEVQQACLEILKGLPESDGKIIEIFGAKFRLEMQNYPVIRFLGTMKNDTFAVPKKFDLGFYIPVSKLFHSAEKLLSSKHWDDLEDWEQFSVLLQSREEMILAKQQHFEEQRLAQKAKAAADQEAGQVQLQKVLKTIGQKVEPIKLSKIGDILRATFATIEITDGEGADESRVTLFVCRGPKGAGTVIRFQNATEGHPMSEQVRLNQYIWQSHLIDYATEDGKPLEGNALLGRQAREWLRLKLREAGAIPPAPEVLTAATTEAITATDENLTAVAPEGEVPGKAPVCETVSAIS